MKISAVKVSKKYLKGHKKNPKISQKYIKSIPKVAQKYTNSMPKVSQKYSIPNPSSNTQALSTIEYYKCLRKIDRPTDRRTNKPPDRQTD